MNTGPSLDFWLDTHDEPEEDGGPSMWDNGFFIYDDDYEEEEDYD